MSRNNQSENVRNAVLKSASKLLLSKGYDGMTLKDISQASQVSTGSIYHFFGSKDGVLSCLVQEMFDRTAVVADAAAHSPADPYLTLAYELAGHIRSISGNQQIAEVYRAAYRSWTLTQVVVSAAVRRNKELFANQLPSWGDDQFFAASSIIKGVLSALVDERVLLDRLTMQQRLEFLLKSVLPVFGATEKRTAMVIAKTLRESAEKLMPEASLEWDSL